MVQTSHSFNNIRSLAHRGDDGKGSFVKKTNAQYGQENNISKKLFGSSAKTKEN